MTIGGCVLFYKQKPADELRMSDWRSDTCSSDLQVSGADLAHHTGAVARGLATAAPDRDEPKPLIVADLPWMSYHTTPVDTLNNAAQLIRAGAQAVKLEGGRKRDRKSTRLNSSH